MSNQLPSDPRRGWDQRAIVPRIDRTGASPDMYRPRTRDPVEVIEAREVPTAGNGRKKTAMLVWSVAMAVTATLIGFWAYLGSRNPSTIHVDVKVPPSPPPAISIPPAPPPAPVVPPVGTTSPTIPGPVIEKAPLTEAPSTFIWPLEELNLGADYETFVQWLLYEDIRKVARPLPEKTASLNISGILMRANLTPEKVLGMYELIDKKKLEAFIATYLSVAQKGELLAWLNGYERLATLDLPKDIWDKVNWARNSHLNNWKNKSDNSPYNEPWVPSLLVYLDGQFTPEQIRAYLFQAEHKSKLPSLKSLITEVREMVKK